MPLSLIWPVNSAIDTSVSVKVESTLVLAANPKRADAVFVNDSNKPIYLARGHVAVLHKGIKLSANGKSYEINANNLFLGEIYAIAQGDAKNLTVSEGVV